MTEALKTELVNFSELTGEAGSARRAELARHVATLFALTSDRCSDEQVDIYDSVLLRLVDMVETEVRRYVADQMASLRRGPEETIRRLADDDIEVAEPILVRSTVLRDADLIKIAEKRGNAHQFAIAQREVLSQEVTDILIRSGDLKVKRKVAGNDGARLSDTSVMALISDAASDATLQLTLSERADLAESHIANLLSVASEEVRRKLHAEGRAQDANRLDEAVDIAAQRMSNQYWLGRYDFETARSRIMLLAKRGMVNEAALRRFASEDRFAEAVATFAWLVRCGVEEVSHWMVRPDPEPFIILAKASGFSSITVGALLGIGPWRHRLTPEQRSDAMSVFERMTIAEAKRKMAHWSHTVLN
ncbi:DUF2336 domain-containing protein [Roseibium denhamense]|uniref:DUF2336 domain-containing protein n=1 Tax=Roseibium denhamense TaxID=76305 RepID=A0ABY1N7I6_9HYPH|nr:DUF2336 domain-containing protein [Roseibium denhamense]MTI06040.1 DUF2336 domain-containing protein [Roseibium denhamense]SMP01794.1 hypothetical protein SAMN06265374_0396 [Roseibium denhamense]